MGDSLTWIRSRRSWFSGCTTLSAYDMLAVVLVTLFASRMLPAQLCAGNSMVGCTHAGAACRPVTTGTGDSGVCNTPKGYKGELTCSCVAAPAPPPPLFDNITITNPTPGTVDIRIDRPNPTRASTDYPSITFQPGDTVTIAAGGCVQSGGSGKTWHRYVNPAGPEGLYHGLVTIPFATGLLDRFEKYQNQPQVKVSTSAPPSSHLQLGFEDDGYADNGYTAHDNGPDNQCLLDHDGGPAWVHLVVVHEGLLPTKTIGGDFDLLWTNWDANGIPLNPDWRSKVESKRNPDPNNCIWPWQGAGLPRCTNQITDTDTWWGCSSSIPFANQNNAFGLDGHANYSAATYDGRVYWESKSGPATDDEYSMNLSTTTSAGGMSPGGLSPARPLGVHVEFGRGDTIDILTADFGLPWWRGLQNAVNNGSAHNYLDGDYTIVTGLMGLDFYHSPGPESHPAWAMAIQGSHESATDSWAIFVRNSGQEGYCSGSEHNVLFPDNQYTFNLTWWPGATSGIVSTSSFWTNATTPLTYSVNFIQGQAVQLTFYNLPDPSAGALIGGELHISWTGGTSSPRIKAPAALKDKVDQEDDAESYVALLTAGLTPAQRAIYDTNLLATKRVQGPKSPVRLESRPPMPMNAKSTRHPQVSAVPDAAFTAQKEAQINALKKAFGGTLPAVTK